MPHIKHFNVSLKVHDQLETFKKIGEIVSLIKPQWATEGLQFHVMSQ